MSATPHVEVLHGVNLDQLGRRDPGHYGSLDLPNTDCDTGRKTAAAEYPLADKTYAQLLDDLSHDDFTTATPELRANILAFYSDPNAPYHTKTNRKSWARTQRELEQLKGL